MLLKNILIQQRTFIAAAIACHLLILLKGQMIAMPLACWLIFLLFDFGNTGQVFALLAAAGLVTVCINYNKTRTAKILALDFLCFFLLASPLVKMMTGVPIQLFNYLGFIIPAALFVLFYTASLILGCRQFLKQRC
jgi:hypothetical protein